MTVKERIMNEIESLPDELLEQIRRYIEAVKTETTGRRHRTMRLKGQFDNLDMRKAAYE
jgi:siroheme synthase (precorrin-2 oxidase/ferrochelatase)